jgi:predicted DNA-binding transcriptional regulator
LNKARLQSALIYPLTHILGVESNLRILRVLAQDHGTVSLSEIARQSELSHARVRRGITSLEKSGVLVEEGTEKPRLFRFNRASYLAPTIEELFAVEGYRSYGITESVRGSVMSHWKSVESFFVFGTVLKSADSMGEHLNIGIVVAADKLEDVVRDVREKLQTAAERLGFRPNLVGLSIDDVSRLVAEGDPWWQAINLENYWLFGQRPEHLARAPG